MALFCRPCCHVYTPFKAVKFYSGCISSFTKLTVSKLTQRLQNEPLHSMFSFQSPPFHVNAPIMYASLFKTNSTYYVRLMSSLLERAYYFCSRPWFFFFNLLFWRKDCAKTIARIKTKFSHNVPLMRLQRTFPFRNANISQRSLVAILSFSMTKFLTSIQQKLLIAPFPNFNTIVLPRSHSERLLLALIK